MAYERMSDEKMEALEKQKHEESLRRSQERADALHPQPAPPPQGAFDPRWPMQHVTVLPDPPRRTAGGDVPVDDGRSEADRLKDPLPRIAALEAKVSNLEQITARMGDALNRYFGVGNEDETNDTPADGR
jgi:hypothetical protein